MLRDRGSRGDTVPRKRCAGPPRVGTDRNWLPLGEDVVESIVVGIDVVEDVGQGEGV